jgi:DNA polymerase-1
MTKKEPIVLVDGSSYLFRAYHALPPLMNSKNQPTGAIFGVANMLKKLLVEYPTHHVAVVFDTKSKNFRHELYPDYKANRPEMPEELASQILPLHELIRAMGLPLIAIEGIEADDVIGSFAKQAIEDNRQVIISTGDKDFAQLVCDKITLINTMSSSRLDEAGVEEKFGVKPNQIIDYLALVGDSVDNVPGVPGVGPKTAAKWLREYHTLENMIAHSHEIKGKVGDNFREKIHYLPMAKKLVTIHQEMPLPITIHDLAIQPKDINKLRTLFTELEFRAWLKELEAKALREQPDSFLDPRAEETSLPKKYEAIYTIEALDTLINKCQEHKKFVLDTETDNLFALEAKLVGLSLSYELGQGAYIPLGHDYENAPIQLSKERVLPKIQKLLADKNNIMIAQNLKYDAQVLKNLNIDIKAQCFDTMLASYILQSAGNRHDMDSLAKKYLGYTTITFEEIAGKGAKQKKFNQIELEQASPYACEDADITYRLYDCFSEKLGHLDKQKWVFDHIEMPLVDVLIKMERHGIAIDVKKLHEQSEELGIKIAKLEEQVYEQSGQVFNLGSPKQLQEILYGKLGLPALEKTPTGQPSTSEAVLNQLSDYHEIPKLILEYRSLSKLKSTYTDSLPLQIFEKTGRIHTSYHQAVTATGRLSSSDPNLQNIPIRTDEGRKIRQAFVAKSGWCLISADYSQVELRIMAHLSKDPGFIKAFQDGADIHRYTAAEVFGVERTEVTDIQRRHAKAINFGLIYGMSAFGLAKQIHASREEAQRYINQYFDRYPGVKTYMDETRAKAKRQGFVETITGRRLYLPEINSKNRMQQQASERAAINAPMQGTAADLIKLAMISSQNWIDTVPDKIKMVLQVHDELVFEVKQEFVEEASVVIKEKMMSALNLEVPLEVSVGVGNNWDEAH